MKINLYKNEIIFVTLIILFGLLLRGYNINFNDFWSDEMVTFYLSNPNLNFTETMRLIFETNLMVTYELTLKFFHKIFGYNFGYSRYLTLFLSIISIFYFYKLIKNNKNYYSALLGVILLSINIYHIRYSVELRSYTLTFLLSIILLNLIFFQGKIREFKNFFSYFLIFIISFFMLFSHAYSIIVIISINFYIFLLWIIKKNFSKNNTLLFLSTSISSLLFILIHINNIFVHTPDWIPEFKSSFFTNYYFSSFFGSRILGLLHLIILIYLITTQFNKVLKKFNIELFLIIFLLLAYMIPITYSLIFKPILIDRYIFFVLIPILYLISGLSFDLKNIYKKYAFIFLLVAPSIFNHFSENTFKQFYTDIYPSKPEVGKSLEHIVKDNNLNYSFVSIENNPYKINFVYENYLKKYSKKIDKNLMYLNYANNTELPDNIWLIYFTDITNEKFIKPIEFKDYMIKSNKIFNHLELYQLKKKD